MTTPNFTGPKIIVGSRRDNLSLDGITNKLDAMIGQELLVTSDVQFDDMYLTGNLIVNGNTVVKGQQTIIESHTIKIRDDMIEINEDNPAPLGLGGIKINRGTNLNPAYFVWDESSQIFRAGLTGNLQAVALRPDTGLANGVVVYNDITKLFVPTNTIQIPMTFQEPITADNGVYLGLASDKPRVTGDSVGNMVLESYSHVKFNLTHPTGSVRMPLDRKLDFGGQASILTDTLGTMHITATKIRAPVQAQIGWSDSVYIESTLDDTTLRLVAPRIDFDVSQDVTFSVPLKLGNTGTIAARPNNLVEITSSGDISLVPNPIGGVVRIPSLSFADDRVRFVTDISGNLSLQTDGDITFSPASNIIVPDTKRLIWSTIAKNMRIHNGDLKMTSDTRIVFESTGNVVVVGPFQVGTYTTLAETNNDTVITNTAGDIILNPTHASGQVVIPANKFLQFASAEHISSDGNHLAIGSGLDIILSAGRQVRIPQNKLLSFGNEFNGMYNNSSGDLCIIGQNRLVIDTPVTLKQNIRFDSTGASITEDIAGTSLRLNAPSSIVSVPRLEVASTMNGTTFSTASLAVAGTFYANGDTFTQGNSNVTSGISAAAGSFKVNSNTLGNAPLELQNRSGTAGSAISMTSLWDSTVGYTIGRGRPSTAGGRTMTFSLPTYDTFYSGTGARPAFYFGNTSDAYIMTMDDQITTLTSGTLRINDSSANALYVTGGITSMGGIYTSTLSIQDVLTANASTGFTLSKLLTAKKGIEVRHNTLNTSLFSVDDTLGTTVSSVFTVNDPSTFNATVSFNQGISVASTSTFTGNMSLVGNRITSLAEPVNANDAATKTYVDERVLGLSHRETAEAATTGDINLQASHSLIDDVGILPGMRVLVKDQLNPIENGIYAVQSDNTIVRTSDFNIGDRGNGAAIFVSAGTAWGANGFVVSGTNLTVGTDPIVWTPYTGTGQILTGTALTKTGNTLSVRIDNSSIITNVNNELQVGSAIVGLGLTGGSGTPISTLANQSHVTTLGTITTGTWNASVLTLPYGGIGITNIPNGRLLLGGTTSDALTYGSIAYNNLTNNLGIGTVAPTSLIEATEAITSAVMQLVSTATTPQLVSMRLRQTGALRTGHLTLQESGELVLGHDDASNTSKLILATGGSLPRVTVHENGQVTMNTSTANGTDILTVAGTVSTGSSKVNGNLTLGNYAVLNAHGQNPTELLVTSPNVNLSAGFTATTSSQVGSIQLITSSTQNFIRSQTTQGVSLPLHLSQSSSVISATAYSQGLHVPNTLTVGGVYTNQTTGYRMSMISNNLHMTPGTSAMTLYINSKTRMSKDLLFWDGFSENNKMQMSLSSNTLSFTAPNDTMFFLVGQGGVSETTTIISNAAGTNYIKFDPTTTVSTFTVSAATETHILGSIAHYGRQFDPTSGGIQQSLSNNGWYYLGQLSVGKTTISASTSWRAKITFDGISTNVDLQMYIRTDVSIVVYKIGTSYHLFLYVSSAPIQIVIHESSSDLSLSQYEGSVTDTPDGFYSGYDPAWVIDYNSQSSQASATAEFGTVVVTNSATLSNLTTTNAVTVGGRLTVNGNSTFTGTEHIWSLPFGNLASLTSDTGSNNTMTIFARDSSTAMLSLDRTTRKATISIPASSSLQYPGSLLLSHNSINTASQIVFSTRATPRMVLNDAGVFNLLSTLDSTGSNDGALVVSGGIHVAKKLFVQASVNTPSLILKNNGTSATSVLAITGTGHFTLSGKRLVQIGDPVDGTDAVSKTYVDNAVQGLSAKEAVVAASAGAGDNVDLSVPLTSLDNVTVFAGDRVLIKNQTNPVENGIYVVENGVAPVRAFDMASGSSAATTSVFVSQGTMNSNTGFLCSTPSGSDTVGINALTFVQFSGAGAILVGPGLEKSGNQINLLPDNYSIEVFAGAIQVKSTAFGIGLTGGSGVPVNITSIAHLSELGTITTGTWQASTIGMQYGGTGSNTFTPNRIPFSNGLKLTEGPLVFDATTVRLGINTTTPTAGLTLLDRSIQLTQTATNPNYMHWSSNAANYSFAMRQSANTFVWSSGFGQDRTTLTDRMFLDSSGTLNTTFGMASPFATLNTQYRLTGNNIERMTAGAMNLSLFSNDNTGTYISMYGGLGTSSSTTNAELMRVGFYNGAYTIQTSGTGTGLNRSLTFQTGTNTGQITLQTSGAVEINGATRVTSTVNAVSVTNGGALTVSGGAAFNGTIYAQRLRLTAGGDGALTLEGGLSITDSLSFDGLVDYLIESPDSQDGLSITTKSTGTNSYVNVSNFDSSASFDSMIRAFAVGKTPADVGASWLQMGYSVLGNTYQVMTQSQASGTVRNLVLGVGTTPQIVITPTTINLNAQTSTASLTLSSTVDASTASNGGTLTVSGGAAIAKNLIVGTALTVPTGHFSGRVEISQAGSSDRATLSYRSPGQLHLRQADATQFFIHAGTSAGPGEANTEFMSMGYLDATDYHITVGKSGSSSYKNLTLTTGTNTSQLRLLSTGNVTTTGAFIVTNTLQSGSTSTGALVIQGGAGIAKNLHVGGSLSIGTTASTGDLVTFYGSSTWTLQNDSVNVRTLLKASAATDIFAFANATGTPVLSVDLNAGSHTVTLNSLVKTSHVTAFSVQDATGNSALIVDTVNRVIDLGDCRVTNVGDPVIATDVANKRYVDNLKKGLGLKESVNAASLAGGSINLLNPLLTLDGVSLQSGYRVLLMNQTDAKDNGIYTVGTGNYLIRADDMTVGSRAAGVYVFIESGVAHADTGFVCIADFPDDIVGTNPITFTQFNGNVISTGQGLIKDGNNIVSISLATNSGLEFNANKLQLSSTLAGNGLSLTNGVLNAVAPTSLGNVTVGTWRATPVELPYGGTGNSSFANGGIPYSTGTMLTSESSNFFWSSVKKTLCIGNNLPDPNTQNEGLTMTKNVALYGASASYLLGDASKYNWRMRRSDDGSGLGTAHLVFSRGLDIARDNLIDTLVMTSNGSVGIGHSVATAADITHTMDVIGTVHITGALKLDTTLSVTNGGTGSASLAPGFLIGNGTNAITSTGAVTNGSIPIGSPSGTVVLESGATLHAHIGLGIGTNVQAWNTNLDAISSLTPSNNVFIVGNGTSFTTVGGSALLQSIGLGDLAGLNTINNTYWSGAQLTVANGGTGTTSFTNNSVPFYSSTTSAMSSTNMYFDSVNSGVGFGTPTVSPGNGLQVYGKDLSIQTDGNITGNYALNFQNSDGRYVWRMRRQDAGLGNGASDLVFSGGIPSTSKSSMTDQFSILSTGQVLVSHTDLSTSQVTGALLVQGGVGIAGNINAGTNTLAASHILINSSMSIDTLTVTNTSTAGISGIAFTDATASSKLRFGWSNSTAPTLASSAVLKIDGTESLHIIASSTRLTSTTQSSSAGTGSLIVSGGVGITKGLFVGADHTAALATGKGNVLSVDDLILTESSTIQDAIMPYFNTAYIGTTTIGTSALNTGITNATTLYIAGAPSIGTNTTISNARSIWVRSGLVQLDGNTRSTDETASTSITTGALVVVGGVGIGGSLYVGGTINSTQVTPSVLRHLKFTSLQHESATLSGNTADGAQIKVAPTTFIDTAALVAATKSKVSMMHMSSVALAASNANVTYTNAATLRISGAPTEGLNVSITNKRALHVESGIIEAGGNVIISNTDEAETLTSAALQVNGGISVTKSMQIGGHVHVAGRMTSAGNVTSPILTPANFVNVSNVTAHKTVCVRNNMDGSLNIMFVVIPAAGDVLSSFTFALPYLIANFTASYDVIAFTDAWTGGASLIKVFNSVAAAVTSSTHVKVQFQSRDATQHYLSVKLEYLTDSFYAGGGVNTNENGELLIPGSNLTMENGVLKVVPNPTFSGIVTINSTVDSTVPTDGSLVVAGGIGVSGDVSGTTFYSHGIRLATVDEVEAAISGGTIQTFSAQDNVLTPTDVTGVVLQGTSFTYQIKSDVNATESSTCLYTMNGTKKQDGSYHIDLEVIGSAEQKIFFSVLPSGQLQYTSPDFPGWTSTTFTITKV